MTGDPGERQADVVARTFGTAGVDRRAFTGWKATLAIVTVVAAGALFLNWLGKATSDPAPGPSPTVVTVTPG